MEKTNSYWDELFSLVDKGGKYYNQCLVRIAWNYYNEREKFCLYKIEFTSANIKGNHHLKYNYGNFRLVKRSLSISDARKLLSIIKSGKMEIDEDTHDISFISLSQQFLASGSIYESVEVDWPTHYCSCSLAPPFREIVSRRLDPAPELPLYSSNVDAVTTFLDLYDNPQYPFSSRIVIMIPDLRARITELRITGKELSVFIENHGHRLQLVKRLHGQIQLLYLRNRHLRNLLFGKIHIYKSLLDH